MCLNISLNKNDIGLLSKSVCVCLYVLYTRTHAHIWNILLNKKSHLKAQNHMMNEKALFRYGSYGEGFYGGESRLFMC